MTVNELNNYMETRIPRALSCEWDNDGLMCCPNGDRKVKKALFCMDVTSAVVKYAVVNGFDVIISHHPMIFRGVKSVCEGGGISGRIIELIGSGISVMSFHTRFDALPGGVNDVLCELFGLSDVVRVECEGIELLRVGNLPSAVAIDSFAANVAQTLGCPHLSYTANSREAYRVAILGGSGGDYIREARAAGADTYISGEIGYHNMVDSADIGINLIEAGHYYTENPSLVSLAKIVSEADSQIECEFYESNAIKQI